MPAKTLEIDTEPIPTGPSPDEVARFEELISAYGRLVRAVVRRTCGRLADLCAEDAEQEVHLALWKSLSEGRTITSPHAFFVQVSTRIAVRMVKKAWRLRAEQDDDAPAESPELSESLLDPYQALGIRKAVENGMARLSAKRRAAVKAYLMGMNHEEIARFYGWTSAGARHAVYDGLKKLRSHLREQGVDLARD